MEVNESGNEFEFEALASARNYRQALIKLIAPHIRGRVLEVGCGVGQFTQELARLPGITHLAGLEPDPAFHAQFRRNNPQATLIGGTAADVTGQWDVIVSVNCLEHIYKDFAELEIYRKLLTENGHLCLFVPARPELYSPIDRKFGHFRRYEKVELVEKLRWAQFSRTRVEYFNPLGYLSWLVMCRLLKSQKFSIGSVRLFDRYILPVSLLLGKVLGQPIGQSLVAIAER